MSTLRLATTPDALARAEWVRDRLMESGTAVSVSLVEGGAGDPIDAFARGDVAFVLVLGTRLRFRRRDGLPILAVLAREEPRDVLVVADGRAAQLRSLEPGARVGVSGARRRAFLRAHRPDLEVVHLSNGRTPAVALESAEADAVVMSLLEARRVGLATLSTEVLDPKEWLPAAGQGTFALIGSREHGKLPGLDAVDHPMSRIALEAELALMDSLSIPAGSALGALAQPAGRSLRLWAAAASEDGRAVIRSDMTGPIDAPGALAEAVAHQLVERGLATVFAGRAP